MRQRVLITHPVKVPRIRSGLEPILNPIAEHSTYTGVLSTSLVGENILRMDHDTGEVSMVVLGEGFTVSVSEDTDS